MLDIATGELDSLDALNTRDLKLAIGEEVDDIDENVEIEQEVEESVESSAEAVENDDKDENVDVNKGVEDLKNLLAALNDKNVAASMKGMKISINITLGES